MFILILLRGKMGIQNFKYLKINQETQEIAIIENIFICHIVISEQGCALMYLSFWG